ATSSETDRVEIGENRAQRRLGLNPRMVVAGARHDGELGVREGRPLPLLERGALDLVPLARLDEDRALEAIETLGEVPRRLAADDALAGAPRGGDRAEAPDRLAVRCRLVKTGRAVAELAEEEPVIGARVVVGGDEGLAPAVVVQPFAAEIEVNE